MENRRTRATILVAANGFVLFQIFQASFNMRALRPGEPISYIAFVILALVGITSAYNLLWFSKVTSAWVVLSEVTAITVFLIFVGVWAAWRVGAFS